MQKCLPKSNPIFQRATFLPQRPIQSPTLSTVSIGTTYEETCKNALSYLGFKLERIGGRDDRGVDLLGVWQIPASSSALPTGGNGVYPRWQALRAVVQCKAHERKPHPYWVRELEGALAGEDERGVENNGDRERGSGETVGVLCASGPVTLGVREAVMRAKRGILWARVEAFGSGSRKRPGRRKGEEERLDEDADVEGGGEDRVMEGRVTQLLWNRTVERLVGSGFGTTIRHRLDPGWEGPREEIVLMLNGKIWDEYGDDKGKDGTEV